MGTELMTLALFISCFNQMSSSQGHFDGFFTKLGTTCPVSGGSSHMPISSSELTTLTAVIKPSSLLWEHERGNISAPCQDPAMMINQGLWPTGHSRSAPRGAGSCQLAPICGNCPCDLELLCVLALQGNNHKTRAASGNCKFFVSYFQTSQGLVNPPL